AHKRRLLERPAVHRVDAVGYADRYVVAAACGRGRRKDAAVRVHARDEQRVEPMFRQRELEIGSDEAIVSLLRAHHEIALLIELRHYGRTGKVLEVVTLDILARGIRVVGARAPEWVGPDLGDIAERGEQVQDGNTATAAIVKKLLVGRYDRFTFAFGQGHRSHFWVEVPAM